MKKLCIAILIMLLACLALPQFVFADAQHVQTYVPEHKQYTISSLVNGKGEIYGASIWGFYFGGSGIVVTTEIYSSAAMRLDFPIGDADFDAENATTAKLTAEQTAIKHRLIDLCEQINDFINLVDACANTQYNGEKGKFLSDVYRYNDAKQGETLKIAKETYEMLQIAKEMYSATSGAFNPAVYRLVDLWGFSSRIIDGNYGLPYDRTWQRPDPKKPSFYPLPEQKYVDAFSTAEFLDFSDSAVQLSQKDDEYFITKNVAAVTVDGVAYDQWLDLGGIAKGYVVDGIKQMLSDVGLQNYNVDAGSSSSALGLSPSGGEITLGVSDPFYQFAAIGIQTLLTFKVGKCSVSNSGQYIRKYVVDGVEYAHIIDGSTGAPAQTGVVSVMVVVPEENGLWAGKSDCLTTALTVMGKDKIVDFVNGYLKQNDISVIVVYQTFDGEKQLLTNLEQNKITPTEHLEGYGWPLVADENGTFRYDADVKFTKTANVYKTLVIVLASVVGAAVLAIVVYHFVRGRKTALQNVQFARKDKPFKPADIGVYLLVVLVIAILFGVIFGGEKQNWKTLQVVDAQTGEQLFYYNAVRNEFKKNDDNSNGWQIQAVSADGGWEVTFSREIDGEMHFNKMLVTRGATPTVTMVDSLCGFHQDCVHNFGKISVSGGVIVCSPNRLKVTTN